MSLGVKEIYYGLKSPGDGASGIAEGWLPKEEMRWYRAPEMHGRIRVEEVRAQFRRYCEGTPDTVLRRWAKTLADAT